MSGSVEDFDGLCGIIAPFAGSSLQLKCLYELGHGGPCSWTKYKSHFQIFGGCCSAPDPERDFIESVLYHKK